ncbi:hypothetical protein BV898_06464 [Hypsibius exemplaris]|uniref:Transmembrane protein 223 n=1 Tax=Hypsibius exemplaris TaxID=2072580 RepID=A0A1W0WWC4_HYPEX|nr:hypothetical protein BV898_06464 [Hypsibius exemplaris]
MLLNVCGPCGKVLFAALSKSPANRLINRSINQSSQRSQTWKPNIHTARVPEPVSEPTNVQKDVLMYSLSSDRFFKHMTIFGAVQMVFWLRMSMVAAETARRRKQLKEQAARDGTPVPDYMPKLDPKEERWYLRMLHAFGQFGEANAVALSMAYLAIGGFIMIGTFFFSLRNIKQLVLLKGGQKLSITTYGTFGRFRTFQVPVKDVSSEVGRTTLAGYAPLKVKGRAYFFLLDRGGKFHNATLFDMTAGLQRRWRS